MWSNMNGGSQQQQQQPPEDSWEDLLDSGQLDQQLRNLNFNVPPPNVVFSQPPPPIIPPQQPYPTPPQPLGPNRGGVQVMTSRAPVKFYQPGYVNPGPIPPSTPHNMFQVPPPSPMYHQHFQQQQQQQQHQPPLSIAQSPSYSKLEVIQQTQNITEHGLISQYQPPEPKMKILKRPQSSPCDLNAQGSKSSSEKSKAKTLKQREEEYAQARLRILGSAGHPDQFEADDDEEDESGGQSGAFSEQRPKNVNPLMEQIVRRSDIAIRSPKGPDGTSGFVQKE